MTYTIHTPAKIVFGIGEFDNIKAYVDEFSPTKILVVTGRQAMKKFEYLDKIFGYLGSYNILTFSGIEPNPSTASIDKGATLAINEKVDLIIGLGGGSVLDAAKSISFLMTNGGTANDYLYRKKVITKKGCPLIAIPATAGSGSEVSKSVVVTDKEKGYKYSISHQFLRPSVALIDPLFTLTLSEENTSSGCADIVAHATEGYLCKQKTNPFAKICALHALKLAFRYLPLVVNSPKDIKIREKIAEASLFAGLSFSNSGTLSPHSFSYYLTTNFNIAHGFAVIITHPPFLRLWAKAVENDILEIARELNISSIGGFIEAIINLAKDLNIKMKLRKYGVTKEDKKSIVENAMKLYKKRDPVEISIKDLECVFDEIY